MSLSLLFFVRLMKITINGVLRCASLPAILAQYIALSSCTFLLDEKMDRLLNIE